MSREQYLDRSVPQDYEVCKVLACFNVVCRVKIFERRKSEKHFELPCCFRSTALFEACSVMIVVKLNIFNEVYRGSEGKD